MDTNLNKLLLIPDIHGRDFWIDEVKKSNNIIFLGDYTDPYPHEGFDPSLIPSYIRNIIEIPGAIRLLGNHDLSYVLPEMPKCRYQTLQASEIQNLLNNNREKFKLIHEMPNYLFSHAGILEDWMGDLTPSYLNDLWWNKEDDKLSSLLNIISWWRGGYSRFGSCVWSDVREWLQDNRKPWGDKFQIFGHTMLKSGYILHEPNFACIDCQKPVYLNIETGDLEVIK